MVAVFPWEGGVVIRGIRRPPWWWWGLLSISTIRALRIKKSVRSQVKVSKKSDGNIRQLRSHLEVRLKSFEVT